jgi:aspartate/methionine/tyrosine aminotransferase
MDTSRFISDRAKGIDASGIRRVMDLGASLKDPINLSIGQPDFDVPDAIKSAACDAINQGHNRYTQTQGTAELRAAISERLAQEFPATLGRGDQPNQLDRDTGLLITSGVSGGLVLSLLATVGPGDEVVIPDPYFVMYKHLVTLAGATPVFVDTYPDFAVTAERLEAAFTERTKLVLFNTPSNPTGVVATQRVCQEVVELCERRDVLLLSDEIYDEFCYEKTEIDGGTWCPSPLHNSPNALLLRGYSKTYGMTGWRLGYAAGPAPIIEQMTKLQQYSFVCAPSMVQAAGALALGVDMAEHVSAYERKRDRVVERLSPHYDLTTPGGAFYAFPEVPPALGLTATQFVEKAIAHNLLIIPGNVFSQRDTHFRLSYACDDAMLERGLDVLVQLASD